MSAAIEENRVHGFYAWIARHATVKWVVLAFVVQTVVQVYTSVNFVSLFHEYSGGRTIPDMTFGYDTAYAKDLLFNTPPEGWSLYLTRILPIDLVFPLLYSVFYALLTSLLVQKSFGVKSWVHKLTILPFVAAAFDYVENASVAMMVTSLPDFSPTTATIASYATIAKWSFTGIGVAILLVCLIKIVMNWSKKPT